jgi:hypothetical protein
MRKLENGTGCGKIILMFIMAAMAVREVIR